MNVLARSNSLKKQLQAFKEGYIRLVQHAIYINGKKKKIFAMASNVKNVNEMK